MCVVRLLIKISTVVAFSKNVTQIFIFISKSKQKDYNTENLELLAHTHSIEEDIKFHNLSATIEEHVLYTRGNTSVCVATCLGSPSPGRSIASFPAPSSVPGNEARLFQYSWKAWYWLKHVLCSVTSEVCLFPWRCG